MEVQTVMIPTFVNPHLFWITQFNNNERSKTLSKMNEQIQDNFNSATLNDSFEIGEMVAVLLDGKYYRAIIEDISNSEQQNKNDSFILCWLIDYGIMYEADIVYKLPSSLRKVTPLAMQASLNNVAYVRQNLSYDQSGLAVKNNEPVSTPSSLAHKMSLELISNLNDLQFKVENKVDGIYFGDILYKENQELKSLRQTLIDRGILMIEETLFKEIQENIYSYKEAHLWLIAKICKKINSIQFLKGVRDDSWCGKIISKYLAEFEESDLFDDVELTGPLHRRSRSRNTTNDSQSSINSGNETMSDIDIPSNKSDTSSSPKGPSKNRVKLILDKMKKQKLDSKSSKCILSGHKLSDKVNDQFADDDANGCNKEPSEPTSTHLEEGKNRNSVFKEKNITSSNSGKEYKMQETNSLIKKRVIPSNAVCVPGGATFSLLHMKKKRVYSSPNQEITDFPPKIFSDEEVSDCKTINITNESTKKESSPSEDTSVSEECKVKEGSVENGQVNQLQIKSFCSCRQCDHWTNDNDWAIETKFLNESKESKHLTINKPQTLFIREDQNSEVERTIIPLNYSSKTKLQKQSMLKMLVHGEYSQAPVRSVAEVYFHEGIRNNLHQLKYREAKRIQMYTWPGILRQQHVFMINGPQSGKTLAYLPVILTFLLEKNERYESFMSKTSGPIAVILCANSKKCEEIYDLSKTILGRNRIKVSLITYPLSHINAKYMDMLITTPTILIDLLKSKAINFKRLCHLILEDGDKILKLESEIMNRVFDLTQSMLYNRIYPKPVQLIVCAEHWDLCLENLIHKLSKVPLICIGNHLEATLYGKIQFSMKFANSACKEHELKNILKDTFRICKSIIVCKEEEIDEVKTILMLKGIDGTIISEDLSKEDILYLEEIWTQCKGGNYTVLVCTDFLLNTLLTITSASLLIHYSLPNSWTLFVKRFGCLLENCKSPFENKNVKMKCQSIVLCDEKCEEQMPKFFNSINSTGLKNQMPDKLKMFSEGLKHSEEQKKVKNKIGLCETIKLFGTCSLVNCPWRHVVDKDLDISNYLPQSGKVKFKIIHIHDVTTYSVQLLQHIDIENNVHEVFDNPDVTEELTSVIKISKKKVSNPVVGHQYAYYDVGEFEGLYYRCDLLELKGESIKIKLIDNGNIIRTDKNRLFKLPKEFQNKPRKIIDAYLANFTPPYRDENFSAKSFFNLKKLLEKYDYENVIMTADIHLQIGNALWLKNVYEEVVLSEKVVPRFQLTREILVSKLAEYNNNQLNSLYKLCKEASISLPLYEKPIKRSVKEERKSEPQWAHLDDNINEVTFSAAVSPDEIYVRLNKFNQQLYSMQKEIQESLKKPNYPKLQSVEIGTICLAKDPEEIDYARVIVRNIENDKALCFFVDFGDEAVTNISDIKYIHNKFITKLPFQSIQCRLHGIKPALNEWQSDINNILYEYATEPNTDIFRLLFIKTCSKEKNDVHPNQNRYSVLLKDGFGEKRILINSILIECGVAVPSSEQMDDFEISNTGFNVDESDEEFDHIIDICRKTKEVQENLHVNDDQSTKDLVNDDMELFLIDEEEFFKSLLTVKNDVISKSSGELPAIQAAPPVDYCTPEVYWSQTEKYIKMDIKLHDVDKYTFNLTKGTILHFKTVKNEKTYKLTLMLYQRVRSTQHTAMGPQIRVTLTKTENVEWPRLTLSKQRVRNIHYDISTIPIKEDTKKILELPKMSDEEEDNDNIDVMYHVVSDIDSDMDADLAEDSD